MKAIAIVRTACRIRRFEARRQATVHQLLENLTDPTLIERMEKPEDRVMVLTDKGHGLARKMVYSKKREIIQ